MKTPRWFLRKNLISLILLPISGLYFIASNIDYKIKKIRAYKSRRVVICFGNILAGGVGKTPIVRNVAKYFDAPVVMRGYKKTAQTGDIGDEAQMLSNDGILVHVGNRKSNLILLNKQKSDTPIIMDDGFQNPSIKKDISVLVFDEGIGYGNKFLLPAGPLREGINAVNRADAIIVIKRKKKAKNFMLPTSLPIFYAKNSEVCPYNSKTDVVVFAGIGYPKKFFDNVPCHIVARRAYPDHYQYTDDDIHSLIKLAKRKNAKLLTTEKDWVRIPEWARAEIKFSKLNTEIDKSFYDWIKGKVNDIVNQKS